MSAGLFAGQYFLADGWNQIGSKLSVGDFFGTSDIDADNIFFRHTSFVRVIFSHRPALRDLFVVYDENIFRGCRECRECKQNEG